MDHFSVHRCGMDGLVPLTRSGERLQLERKLMNQAMSPSAVRLWQPAVREEVRGLLAGLMAVPDEYVAQFKRYVTSLLMRDSTLIAISMAGSLIFRTVYGYHVRATNDPFIEAADAMMEMGEYAISGGWIVDYLPFREFATSAPQKCPYD